jgi:hypothetical protein
MKKTLFIIKRDWRSKKRAKKRRKNVRDKPI